MDSSLVNGAMLLAFVQAPSLHVHQHEANQRHAGAFLHTHFAHDQAAHPKQSEAQVIDPDDDAQFLSWLLDVPGNSGFAPVILAASALVIPAPELSAWPTIALRPSAHDPPVLTATPPRAPPV